ncbi:MAG: hypothetical protein IT422_10620 [Pirellulaceae bacterium]|jgi:hypothetical protein|nr:hypothetical protein [Pirellulaceae bacterium]
MWSRLSIANSSIDASPRRVCGSPFRPVSQIYRPAIVLLLLAIWQLLFVQPPATAQELAQQSSHEPSQNQTETQASGSPRPIAATHSARQVAAQILQQSILQSVWGPPAYCVVRQSVTLFDKQLNGVGKYVRGGQGSGKLKFDLRMPAGDQINTLLQVSDGQRLLSIEAIGDVRRRTEVDLGKVRPRLVLTNESLRDPVVAMYLAIGGQAETLRKIYQKYDWVSVREGKLGDIPVWWLGGRVPPIPVNIRSIAEVDNLMFVENNSGLLPTHIEIAIGKADAPLPFWLYQMEQGRASDELSPLARSEKLRIVTEWATPIVLTADQMPDSLFDPPSSNEPLFDETDRYLPPATSVAAAPTPETLR